MNCDRSNAEMLSYFSQVTYCGGYSGGEPPLPIPNREVKPAIADGTAPPGGRVGSCRFSGSPMRNHRTSFFLSGSCLRMLIAVLPRPLLYPLGLVRPKPRRPFCLSVFSPFVENTRPGRCADAPSAPLANGRDSRRCVDGERAGG